MLANRTPAVLNLRIALSFASVFILACLSLLYVSGSSIDDLDHDLPGGDSKPSWTRFIPYPRPKSEPQLNPPPPFPPPEGHTLASHASRPQPLTHDIQPLRKLRIIHFIDHDTYKSVTDRWFLHSASAFSQNASSHIIAESVLWGPGFPGWVADKTISENIALKYGSVDHFDACMLYFNTDQLRERKKLIHIFETMTDAGVDPDDLPQLRKWFYYEPWVKELNEWSKAGKGTILIDRPHELRENRRKDFYADTNITLILAPYPGELFDYRKQFGEKAMLVHQPHFVDPDVFFQPIDQTDRVSRGQFPRDIDVLIAGAIIKDWYPFRRRLADMVEEKKFPSNIKAVLRTHPGYGDLATPAAKKKMSSNTQEKQLSEFSKQMGQSKICFVTSSRWGYSVQKYIEAASAGCLIMGNIPIDRTALFSQHIVEVTNADSDEDIFKTIRHWLDPAQDEERLKRVRKAQRWVLDNFSTNVYVKEVVRHIRAVRDGQRGMVLPWEWEFERKGTLEELPMDG